MQKRVVLVSAVVAALGLAAAVLGFVAESTKSKAFVRFDGESCVYRRTPALACSVAAALLALAGRAIAAVASRGCPRSDAPVAGSRCADAVTLSKIAWVVVAVAVLMFLCGAEDMNWGRTRGPSSASCRGWRRYDYHYGCTHLRSGFFATASVLSAVATGCAIAAYVYFQRTDELAPAPGVEMGQPFPPQYMAWPAPPQYEHDGYGPEQPAGTAY